MVMTVPGGVTLLGGPATVNAATGTYTASGINVSLSRIDIACMQGLQAQECLRAHDGLGCHAPGWNQRELTPQPAGPTRIVMRADLAVALVRRRPC